MTALKKSTTVQNGTLSIDGQLAPWSDAQVPLMSDAVLRALSVFDGLVAVRRGDSFEFVAPQQHYRRLLKSAQVIGLAHSFDQNYISHACEITAESEFHATNADVVYVRPMLIGAELSDVANQTSLVVTSFAQPNYFESSKAFNLQTSALRRPPGDSFSPYAKATANYHLTRLARIHASSAGFDDALFLNSQGRVAEAAGSAIIFAKDGVICTPPASEDCLPSITIELLQKLSDKAGIPFEIRPVSLAEAYASDGAALVGTLSPLNMIKKLDHVSYEDSEIISKLRNSFFKFLQD